MSKNELKLNDEKEMFQSAVTMYTSMKCETIEEKKALFNTINSPDHSLSEYLGKVIDIKDVFCEPVQMENLEGETVICPRVVIVDKKGETYQSVSFGVYNALTKLMAIFGQPTWDMDMKVEVKQINLDGGKRVFTLEAI